LEPATTDPVNRKITVKISLLEILACPRCGGWLAVKEASRNASDITEGTLWCACGSTFQIEGAIPRFVSTDNYVRSFSFQWRKHQRTQLDVNDRRESEETFLLSTGLTRDELAGKLVLDVGCGMGRFADVASRFGAEVVGVDLSYAIESAHKNIGARPNVHLAQADLFHLPFRKETFDCIFSIGVLHHTPDCRKAVLSLIPFLKEGGILAVWVYQKYKLHTLCQYSPERFTARPGELPYVLQAPFRVSPRWMPIVARTAIWVDRLNNVWNGTVRAVAQRLPVKVLYALCHAAIPLYHVLKLRPFTPLRLIIKISMHPDPEWRVLDTFDNLSPRYQSRHTYEEVCGWFEEGGLRNIVLLPNQIAVRGQR